VGIQISQQQGKLKEDDAGAPDKIAAAKPRQKYFGNDQLDLEEQKSGYKTKSVQIVDFFHDTPYLKASPDFEAGVNTISVATPTPFLNFL
jgi:hypothetical protein